MNNKLALQILTTLLGVSIIAGNLIARHPDRYEDSEYEFYQDDEGAYDDDYDRNAAARGLLGGAATGALIGGIAGGGRGAGIGAGVGAGLGLVSGAAVDESRARRRERARIHQDERASRREYNRRMREERQSRRADLPEQVYY